MDFNFVFNVVIAPVLGIAIAYAMFNFVADTIEKYEPTPMNKDLMWFTHKIALAFVQFWVSSAITNALGVQGQTAVIVFISSIALFPLWYGVARKYGYFAQKLSTEPESKA